MLNKKKPQKPLTPQAFKALRDKWYAKLAKSGFQDIEDNNSPRQMLKAWHSSDIPRKVQAGGYAETVSYYEQAREFLNWYEFESKKHYNIWALHAEGASVRAIAKKVRMSKTKVHKIITFLRRESKCHN